MGTESEFDPIESKNARTLSVFFDTEFTSLEFGIAPKLISIGCASEDGKEFYAELSDSYTLADCSGFVIQNVLPLLQGGQVRMPASRAARELKDWIESLDGSVILRSDAPQFDWHLIAMLLETHVGWPVNLRDKAGSVICRTPKQAQRFAEGLSVYWANTSAQGKFPRRHHALDDARSLRFAWEFIAK